MPNNECPTLQQEFCDERFGNLAKAIDILDNKMDKLDEFLRGNGKPGLVVRLDRLEEARKRQVKFLWLAIGGIVSMVFTIAGMVFEKLI